MKLKISLTQLKWIFTLAILVSVSTCSQPKQEETVTSIHNSKTYEANWESLSQYQIPEWFQDAKFGIFIHWGPYAVPAFGSEWYPRLMYMDTATFTAYHELSNEGPNPIYLHHKKKWGDQKQFGYKDFIPMFKGENFDPKEWIDLFKKAGAKYVVPVAEHHDGFAMYNSKITRWNAVKMGPKRDILGELFTEGKSQGLHMGASSHFAFNWAFYNKKAHFDTVDPEYADLYSSRGIDPEEPVSEAFKELWWNRITDIIDNYQPEILWMDFFWDQEAFKPYHSKLAAYLYNKGLESGKELVLQDKNHRYEAFPEGTIVYDLERGKMADINKKPWQTDTSIGKNSWCYVENWQSKDVNTLIDDLIDIVSKNGCLLLNVGPKSDGTIPQDQQDILLAIGKWLKTNGDAIYGSRCWKVYGEGPTVSAEGYMSEKTKQDKFLARDIRYTTNNGKLYAIALDWPESGKIHVNQLAMGSKNCKWPIENLRLLGCEEQIKWEQTEKELQIQLPQQKPGEYAYVFEIDFGSHSEIAIQNHLSD